MKKIVCELCEGNEFTKTGDQFVCNGCGTAYSLEQVKSMMKEVEASAAQASCASKELENLYVLARRAREMNNAEQALEYYGKILPHDPTSWEATFYSVYFQSKKCKIGEIGSAAMRIVNCEQTTFELIREHVADSNQRDKAVREVVSQLKSISGFLFSGYHNYFHGIDEQIKSNYTNEYYSNCGAAVLILSHCADLLLALFDDVYADAALELLRKAEMYDEILLQWKYDPQIKLRVRDYRITCGIINTRKQEKEGDEFWVHNHELKEELEKELEEYNKVRDEIRAKLDILNTQIFKVKKEIFLHSDSSKKEKLITRKNLLLKRLERLSLIEFKEKKTIKDEVQQIEVELKNFQDAVKREEKEFEMASKHLYEEREPLQDQLSAISQKIDKINRELKYGRKV